MASKVRIADITLPGENWRTVPDKYGELDLYWVSDFGRVYSAHQGGRLLKPGIASHGYPTVCLGKGHTRTVHSLVAQAFLGPCPNGMEVLHSDGNRQHPALCNLRYGTRSDNVHDMYRHGTTNAEGWLRTFHATIAARRLAGRR